MTILADRPEADDHKLSRSEIEGCNELALKYLQLDETDLRRKKILHDLQSVYYKEEDNGGALLVCVDGTVLFADREIVPLAKHKQAFEGGLRSNKARLKDRKKSL